MTFADLLDAFAAAVTANDGEGLASLFTKDGTYEDGFFGVHTGRPAIAAMLQRFHDTGRDESAGRPVMFGGISCFHFRDGPIAHYGEAFDRGVTLAQLDFPAERITRIFPKAAAAQNRSPEAARHLDRLSVS